MLYSFSNFTKQLKASGFDPDEGLIAFYSGYSGYSAFIIAASINGFIFPVVAVEFSTGTLAQQEILAVVASLCLNANQYLPCSLLC